MGSRGWSHLSSLKEGRGSSGALALLDGAGRAGGQREGEAGTTRDWGAEEDFGGVGGRGG